MDEIRLTQYSKGAGCGCKIAPKDLSEILAGNYATTQFEHLRVGNATHDDAAVYDLGNNTCLISTTDFFTPIVDSPKDFGKIAAANALSDVYAMGGKPIMAIAILGWPVGKLPNALAQQVIEGARTLCTFANIPLAGGHSIDAPEPFFGLCVNGIAQTSNIKTNGNARVGDILYLTKPIGSGLLTTAQKRGILPNEKYTLLLSYLTHLNVEGSFFGEMSFVTSMTDVTGFGLLGHLKEMCEASHTTAILNFNNVPIIDGANEIAKSFVYPDNTMRNYQAMTPHVTGLNANNMFTLCDPQTNGGLLVAVDSAAKNEFENRCKQKQIRIFEIGRMQEHSVSEIIIE